MKKYKINPEQNIGDVIFIVEGAVCEFNIAHTIFVENLNYDLIKKTRNNSLFQYQNSHNPNSRVAVLNCTNNQLHTLDLDEIDRIYVELVDKYDFDLANSAIFLLYDRDVHSYTGNKQDIPRDYIQKFAHARAEDRTEVISGYDGLLLLSYPCIEAFVTSCFDDNTHQYLHEKGHNDLKLFNDNKKYYQNNINISSLAKAVSQMDKSLELLGITKYDFSDFAKTNLMLFDEQERVYRQNKKFRLLSLFCIALMELGIIEEETDVDLSEPR